MALRYAVNSGNWSSLATWDGGASLPGAADDVYANNRTVTIDQNVTVLSVRTTAGAPAVAGGGFTLGNGFTLTANVYAGSTSCVTISAAGATCAVVGAVYGSSTVSYCNGVLVNAASVTLTVTGACTGGSYAEAVGTSALATGSALTLNGNIVGTGNVSAVYLTHSGGSLSVTGGINAGVTSGVNARAVNWAHASAGNVTAGGGNFGLYPLQYSGNGTVVLSPTNTVASGPGYYFSGNGANITLHSGLAPTNVQGLEIAGPNNTLTVNGNVTGGSTANQIYGLRILESGGVSGPVTVNGNVLGSALPGATVSYGIYANSSSHTVTIVGNCTAQVASAVVLSSNAGGSARALTVTGDIAGAISQGGVYLQGNYDTLVHVGSLNPGATSGRTSAATVSSSLAGNCSFSGGEHGFEPVNYAGNGTCTLTPTNPLTCGPLYRHMGPGTMTINGNIRAGINHGVYHSSGSGGTLNINGSVTGSSNLVNMHGIYGDRTSYTINIAGNVVGGSMAGGTETLGVSISGVANTLNIAGNVTSMVGGGVNASGANNNVTVTGNVASTVTQHALRVGGNYSTLVVNGGLNAGLATQGLQWAAWVSSGLAGNVTVSGGDFGYHAMNYAGAGVCSLTPTNPTSTITRVVMGGSGTMTIASNITATFTHGAEMNGAGVLNIIGNVTGTSSALAGNSAAGIYHAGAGTTNVTGNVTAGGLGSPGSPGALQAHATGTLNITGNVTALNSAGGNYGGPGAYNSSTGAINIYGTAFASNVGPQFNHGVVNNSTGTCFVQVSKSNDYPNAGVTTSAYGTSQSVGTGWITVDAMEDGSGGWPAGNGRHFVRDIGTNFCKMRNSNAGSVTIMGEVGNDYPLTTNVRSGVTYDFGGKVGTCVIPPAAAVALGVPVDHTTGTAMLSPADVWAHVNRSLTDKAGFDLTSAYDAAKTASQFNPATDTVAHVTLADTVTTLTNSPDVPTEAEIATQVRTELTTELARIDQAVSAAKTLTVAYDAAKTAASSADLTAAVANILANIPEGLTAAEVWAYVARTLTAGDVSGTLRTRLESVATVQTTGDQLAAMGA